MNDQVKWRREVDQAILATLAESAASLVPIGAAGLDLTQVIARATEGGKRVRSTMLIASHHAHSGAHHRAAVTLAAALELFHAAALLHDDVLDDSDTRRGKPSAHRVLGALHRERGWIGDADDYGRAGAILAGDLTLMASTRALQAAAGRLPAESSERVLGLFLEMSDLVTAGQYLDMRTAAQPLDDLPDQEVDIRATMRAKTASYTCEMPLALGAAVAGATDAEIDAVREVGVPLGVAFQLRDDILGLVGTAATGKPSGDDVREGKRTLVLYLAWTQATRPPADRDPTRARGPHASASDVAGAVKAIKATGVHRGGRARDHDHGGAGARGARGARPGAAVRPHPRRRRGGRGPARSVVAPENGAGTKRRSGTVPRTGTGRRASRASGDPPEARQWGCPPTRRSRVEHPFHGGVVVEPRVGEERQGPPQRGDGLQLIVNLDEERLGNVERVVLSPPHGEERTLAKEVAHARGSDAESLGDIGNGEPHGFVVHHPRLQRKRARRGPRRGRPIAAPALVRPGSRGGPYNGSVPETLIDPLVGRVVDGRYVVRELIARGGMASVYRATDKRLGRDIALKIMSAEASSGSPVTSPPASGARRARPRGSPTRAWSGSTTRVRTAISTT